MALLMRELGGHTYAEIAEFLETDEEAVKGLIARARVGSADVSRGDRVAVRDRPLDYRRRARRTPLRQDDPAAPADLPIVPLIPSSAPQRRKDTARGTAAAGRRRRHRRTLERRAGRRQGRGARLRTHASGRHLRRLGVRGRGRRRHGLHRADPQARDRADPASRKARPANHKPRSASRRPSRPRHRPYARTADSGETHHAAVISKPATHTATRRRSTRQRVQPPSRIGPRSPSSSCRRPSRPTARRRSHRPRCGCRRRRWRRYRRRQRCRHPRRRRRRRRCRRRRRQRPRHRCRRWPGTHADRAAGTHADDNNGPRVRLRPEFHDRFREPGLDHEHGHDHDPDVDHDDAELDSDRDRHHHNPDSDSDHQRLDLPGLGPRRRPRPRLASGHQHRYNDADDHGSNFDGRSTTTPTTYTPSTTTTSHTWSNPYEGSSVPGHPERRPTVQLDRLRLVQLVRAPPLAARISRAGSD